MRKYLLAFFLCGFALASWGWALYIAADQETASIEVEFGGSPVVGTQLFFAQANDFSERRSSTLLEEKAVWRISVPVGQAETLRIDPPPGVAVSICRLNVDFSGASTRSLGDYRLAGLHHIQEVRQEGACLTVIPLADGNDPQVLLASANASEHAPSPDLISAVGVAVAGVLALLFAAWILCSREPAVAESFADRVGGSLVAIYFLLSLLAGFAYAVVTPPGAVADEYAHVTKAVKVSSGVLVGATGDRLFPNIFEMYGAFNGYLDPGVHFSKPQLLAQLETPVPCAPTTAALPSGADSYAPHLYMAPAASYALSCAVGLDTGAFFLIGRLGNLLIATLLIALGLWATRRARWALFVCALLPMTVYQVASLSADSLYIALSFAWIGVICGLIEGRIPIAKAKWFLAPLALALAISKPGAAWVLVALLFTRPLYLRETGRFWPTGVLLLVLPLLAHLLWVIYAGGSAAPLDGVDPAANIQRLHSDPLGAAAVFGQTFFGPHGVWIWKSALGVLGWLDVYLSSFTYLGLSLCLLASLWMGLDGSRCLPTWVSGAAVLFSGGAALMLALPLFIFWTFHESNVVMGLQGRYFLPCIAFAACFLARGGDQRVRACLSVVVPLVLMYALVDGLFALITRYYP
ncbi:DUF2142 domain-containing protein [Luteimonas sp. 100069]|uniref:DUF2142 domain-containing protein n=1 Tax=Luteimonas sp. 100069 TaxID=2006109 RepID=UPI0013158372|nr:DUF2142 domain-containing protein [Luteimonas sp. 100069]